MNQIGKLSEREVTDRDLYLRRRDFLATGARAAMLASLPGLAACGGDPPAQASEASPPAGTRALAHVVPVGHSQVVAPNQGRGS